MLFIHSYPSGAIRKKVGCYWAKDYLHSPVWKRAISVWAWGSDFLLVLEELTILLTPQAEQGWKKEPVYVHKGTWKENNRYWCYSTVLWEKYPVTSQALVKSPKPLFITINNMWKKNSGGVQWRSCFGLDMGGLRDIAVGLFRMPCWQVQSHHRRLPLLGPKHLCSGQLQWPDQCPPCFPTHATLPQSSEVSLPALHQVSPDIWIFKAA